MTGARFIVGDVREVLATLPDASVDLVFTSPPFLALRSYLPADHPDKHREIGSEADPGAFIDTLLAVTEDLARVLAPHGSLCVELGDTYAGSDNRGTNNGVLGGLVGDPGRHDAKVGRIQTGPGWPEAKSACLIPELYRLSLAYGRNPLTGRETPRWRVRNTIRWCRPNPPVGALGDKFRPATSEIVVACKARDRYFDLDAVRGPVSDDPFSRGTPNGAGRNGDPGRYDANPAGAPPLDWWKIPTHGYPGAHYATFPPALVTVPLLSMCPERVCTTCGQPSRRSAGEAEYVNAKSGETVDKARWLDGERQTQGAIGRDNGSLRVAPTLGCCGHNAYRRGCVLDPFGGSGTVAEVATGNGRDAILIDLDRRNAELARARVGMFLTVEEPAFEVPE